MCFAGSGGDVGGDHGIGERGRLTTDRTISAAELTAWAAAAANFRRNAEHHKQVRVRVRLKLRLG